MGRWVIEGSMSVLRRRRILARRRMIAGPKSIEIRRSRAARVGRRTTRAMPALILNRSKA